MFWCLEHKGTELKELVIQEKEIREQEGDEVDSLGFLRRGSSPHEVSFGSLDSELIFFLSVCAQHFLFRHLWSPVD